MSEMIPVFLLSIDILIYQSVEILVLEYEKLDTRQSFLLLLKLWQKVSLEGSHTSLVFHDSG